MISFLSWYIIFNKHTNKYPINRISEYYIEDLKKILRKNGNSFEIQFVKKDNNWICENNSLLVKLDLNGYAFEKAYLISYVIRNLRYPLISNKQPFKNGISKYGLIAKHISFAPFYLSGLSNRHYQSIRNFKCHIDEKIYKHFYIKNK